MIHSTLKATLKLGDSGSEVVNLQRLLSQKLRPLSLTGRFDYETEIAVKSFQSRMFLKPDGIVGARTWQVLYTDVPVGLPNLSQGCCGDAVTTIQELLAIDHYYTGNIDGNFGPLTHLAVQHFQADFGLTADGVFNAEGWRALSEI